MKILFLVHGFPPADIGGTEAYVRSLAEHLLAAGHDVCVVHGMQSARETPGVETVRDGALRVHRVYRTGIFVDAWDKSSAPEVEAILGSLLDAEKPDLVHVHHWIRLSRGLAATCREAGIPVVATLHDTWTSCPRAFRIRDGRYCDRPLGVESCLVCVPRNPWQRDDEIASGISLFRRDAIQELQRAARVLVPTESLLRTLEAGLGISLGNALVLPHGTLAKTGARAAVPSADGLIRVGFWGHQVPLKGPDLLLDAAGRLDGPVRKRFQFHLWGEATGGEYGARLEELALSAPAFFHGAFHPPDIEGAALDWAAFPSRAFESYSMVLDEAWALRLPVIAPSRGAFAERIGGGGLLFEPDDADALAAVLRRIAAEPGLQARLRAQIPSPVPMEEHARRLAEIYGEVAGKRPESAPRDPDLERDHRIHRALVRERRIVQLMETLGRNGQLEDRLSGLERVVREASGSAAASRESLRELQREIAVRDSERERLAAAYRDLEIDRDAWKANCETMDGEIQTVRRDARALERDRDRLKSECAELQASRDGLLAESRSAWKAVESNHEALRAVERELARTREELAAAGARASRAVAMPAAQSGGTPSEEILGQLRALARDLEAAGGERDSARLRIQTLESDLARALARLALERRRQEELQASLDGLAEALGLPAGADRFRELEAGMREQILLGRELAASLERITAEAQAIDAEKQRLLVDLEAAERREAELLRHPLLRLAGGLGARRRRAHRGSGLRILMVVHDFLPRHAAGSEVYTFRLSKALQARGHDVRVLTTEAHPGIHSYHVRERDEGGLAVTEITHQHHARHFDLTYRDPSMDRIFAETLDRVQPDVLHVQHLHYHSIGYLARARERGIPVVYTLHEYMLLCPRGGQMLREDMTVCERPVPEVCAGCVDHLDLSPPPAGEGRAPPSARLTRFLPHAWKERVKAWLDGPAAGLPAVRAASPGEYAAAISRRLADIKSELDHVDLFLSPSEFLRSKFIECGMIPPERILCSHNGQDRSPFAGCMRTPSDTFRAGYIGTISDFKGVDLLVDAMNQLRDLDDVECRIYGSLESFPDFARSLIARNVHPGTRFLDRYDPGDVGRILSGLDVLVVPSRWYENSPLTIQEAYMAGLPVVASNLGGMAEFVQHEVTGLLFAPSDAADLAKAIRRLRGDPALLESLRSALPVPKSIEEDAEVTELRYRDIIARTARTVEAAARAERA